MHTQHQHNGARIHTVGHPLPQTAIHFNNHTKNHTYTHVGTHTYNKRKLHECRHYITFTCTHTRIHTQPRINHNHKCTRTYMHTKIHARIRTHHHTHINMRVQTYRTTCTTNNTFIISIHIQQHAHINIQNITQIYIHLYIHNEPNNLQQQHPCRITT